MTSAFNLSQFANKVNTSGQADLTTAVTGVLPVANGGTGLSSPGTSGNVLQSNGSAWTSATIAIFAGNSGQVFTSSGTFTIPSGITKLKVTVVAGGGAGGNAQVVSSGSGQRYYVSGSGGGAGGAAIKFLTGLTPGGTLSVTVGGAGAASSVASGSQSISTVSATAGSAGVDGGIANGQMASASGGAGGIGSGGDMNIQGGGGTSCASGQPNDSYSNQAYPFSASGTGGSSIYGGGGRGLGGYNATSNGIAGGVYGSGGGGAVRMTFTGGTNTGGAGAAGVVVFEW